VYAQDAYVSPSTCSGFALNIRLTFNYSPFFVKVPKYWDKLEYVDPAPEIGYGLRYRIPWDIHRKRAA
jgi:hypothetical protein